MSRGSLILASYTILLLLLPFTVISQTSDTENPLDNCTSSCGDIFISYPFRLKGDPQSCGSNRFELSCEENGTAAVLYLESVRYYVRSIHYNNFTIRVVDSGVQKKNNYCSTPPHSLTTDNFTSVQFFSEYSYALSSFYAPSMEQVPVILVTCATPMSSNLFIEATSCLHNTTTNSSKYSYFMVGSVTSFDLGRTCQITQMLLASPPATYRNLASPWTPATYRNMRSCDSICDELVNGFELSWFVYGCGKCKGDEVCDTSFDDINSLTEPQTIKCRGPSSGERWYDPIKNKFSGKLLLYNSKFHVQLIINAPVYYGKRWISISYSNYTFTVPFNK